MKKILIYLICLLGFMPILVKADMGGPIIKEYEAEIINPDGAAIYKYDLDKKQYVKSGEIIPYGTTVRVNYESSDRATVDFNNQAVEIRVSDITAINKEAKDIEILPEKKDGIVINEAEIKKGPANGYETTGKTIPKNTSIKYQQIKDNEATPWVYVEYDGTKGYISILGGTLAYKENYTPDTIITTKETEIVNFLDSFVTEIDKSKIKVLGKIPAYTTLDSPLEIDTWSYGYYIKYKGIKGLVNKYDIAEQLKNKKLNILNKVDLYEAPLEDSKIIGSLEAGTTIKNPYTIWYRGANCEEYFLYKNEKITGWILYQSCLEDSNAKSLELVDFSDNENDEEDNTDVVTIGANDTQKEIDVKDYVIYCLLGGIALSLTALTTIVLVNRKKKNTIK